MVVKKVRRRQREEEEDDEDGGDGRPRPREPLPAVDSVLDELLANAPAEPNGGTIEAFTEELQRLEARMKNGGDGDDGDTEPQDPPKALLEEEDEDEETFTSFTSPPPRPPDPLAQAVASPPRAVGPPPNQPFTGPFVSALLAKLENMPHNSLYVNVLLTGLVAQLACYPQPLLRSFLLNTNMVFQPSVKSLLQVLGSVKNKIEAFAATQEDFPVLLFKAKKYLIGRLEGTEGSGTGTPPRRSETPGGWVLCGSPR